jgi:hypothetical protein
VAYTKLPRETYTYTAYESEGEFTLRRNRQAFDWVELLPRGIVDVSSVKTATEVLGTPMKFPIMVSPSAGKRLCGPFAWRDRPDFTSFQNASETAAIGRGVSIELGNLKDTQGKPEVGPYAPKK